MFQLILCSLSFAKEDTLGEGGGAQEEPSQCIVVTRTFQLNSAESVAAVLIYLRAELQTATGSDRLGLEMSLFQCLRRSGVLVAESGPQQELVLLLEVPDLIQVVRAIIIEKLDQTNQNVLAFGLKHCRDAQNRKLFLDAIARLINSGVLLKDFLLRDRAVECLLCRLITERVGDDELLTPTLETIGRLPKVSLVREAAASSEGIAMIETREATLAAMVDLIKSRYETYGLAILEDMSRILYSLEFRAFIDENFSPVSANHKELYAEVRLMARFYAHRRIQERIQSRSSSERVESPVLLLDSKDFHNFEWSSRGSFEAVSRYFLTDEGGPRDEVFAKLLSFDRHLLEILASSLFQIESFDDAKLREILKAAILSDGFSEDVYNLFFHRCFFYTPHLEARDQEELGVLFSRENFMRVHAQRLHRLQVPLNYLREALFDVAFNTNNSESISIEIRLLACESLMRLAYPYLGTVWIRQLRKKISKETLDIRKGEIISESALETQTSLSSEIDGLSEKYDDKILSQADRESELAQERLRKRGVDDAELEKLRETYKKQIASMKNDLEAMRARGEIPGRTRFSRGKAKGRNVR
ncbi:MAG: hypothetical protein HYS98_02435 [Deltaproteobacteria bacterium]|nr:hypothetical protein [Deltaproteobacteria bacterium]